MLGKMKLRKAVIKDKLDTLKQVLPLDPVYKQIVKCGYWTMPWYENKIVISRLVTSPFATEAAWVGCQRYTHKQCRLLSSSEQQDSSVGCYCSIQKVLVARVLVRPVCDKGCRKAEGKLQKGAGSWSKQADPAMLFFGALKRYCPFLSEVSAPISQVTLGWLILGAAVPSQASSCRFKALFPIWRKIISVSTCQLRRCLPSDAFQTELPQLCSTAHTGKHTCCWESHSQVWECQQALGICEGHIPDQGVLQC